MNFRAAHGPWRPSPFIRASLLLHAGAAASAILQPEWWAWAASTVAINQAALTAAGLWPRCSLLGPNWTQLPATSAARGEIAVTIDDGPDPEVTPAVLDILEYYRAKATFFCIGERALRHPALCRAIVERGHAVESHSQRHRHNFAFLGYRGFVRELETAQQTLTEITGIRPRFFGLPAGLRNPLLDPALQRLGLRLASWTRRGFDARIGDVDAVSARLIDGLKAGDILLLHDGNAARTRVGEPVISEALPRVLEAAAARGLKAVTLRSTLGDDEFPGQR